MNDLYVRARILSNPKQAQKQSGVSKTEHMALFDTLCFASQASGKPRKAHGILWNWIHCPSYPVVEMCQSGCWCNKLALDGIGGFGAQRGKRGKLQAAMGFAFAAPVSNYPWTLVNRNKAFQCWHLSAIQCASVYQATCQLWAADKGLVQSEHVLSISVHFSIDSDKNTSAQAWFHAHPINLVTGESTAWKGCSQVQIEITLLLEAR